MSKPSQIEYPQTLQQVSFTPVLSLISALTPWTFTGLLCSCCPSPLFTQWDTGWQALSEISPSHIVGPHPGITQPTQGSPTKLQEELAERFFLRLAKA